MEAIQRVKTLTEEQVKRYSRHIVLSQVGGEGQKKLLNGRVLLVGAGGLGSPTAMYLAAAGVGTLGMVDFDVVDLSNLQRQVIHHTHDIGRPKVTSAAETIADMNPDVRVIQHQVAFNSSNALDIISGYDIVVDCCDNFPSRYLVNDACVLARKPSVYGSIYRFDGMATVFLPGKGCLRCVYPTPPPPGSVPSSREVGVLGVVPGIIGVIQATETIKLILGIGDSLAGSLLVYDALDMEFRKMKLARNPACPVCGPKPTITSMVDYEQFCGFPGSAY